MSRRSRRTRGPLAVAMGGMLAIGWLAAANELRVEDALAASPAAASPGPGSPGAPSPATASGGAVRQVRVDVPANQPLTDTGIDILATDTVHIVATGTIGLVPGDRKSVADPDGEPARFGGCDLGVYCGTLIASLQPTRGWVRAGSEALLSFRSAGRLYLRVNDPDPGRLSGAFKVTIRVGRADQLAVTLPTPAGISRDGVLPAGEAALGLGGGAPPLDLAIGAVLAGLAAFVAPLAWRRLRAGRGAPMPVPVQRAGGDEPAS